MRRRFVVAAVLAGSAAFAAPAHAGSVIEFGDAHGFAYVPSNVHIVPNDSVTWSGNFGVHPLRSASSEPLDGIPAGPGTFSHTFATPGIYRFYCAVHGIKTGPNTVAGMSGQVVVTTNQPPNAAFTQSAGTVASGTTVAFDASSSSDPDGTITAYAWDLDGDGAFDDATGPKASFTYTSPEGQTTPVAVRLRVTDDNSDAVGPESSVAEHDVTVVGPNAPAGGGPGGGGGAGGGGAGGGGPAADTRAPIARLRGRKLVVRARAIKVRLSADEPGRVTMTLKAKGEVLAKGSGRVGRTARTLRLKLTAAGRKRLRHGQRVKAQLVVVVRDAAGNRRTLRRTVTVRT
jgi:plastocyanin